MRICKHEAMSDTADVFRVRGRVPCPTSMIKFRMHCFSNKCSTVFYSIYWMVYRNGLTPKNVPFFVHGRYDWPVRKRLIENFMF